MIYDITSSINIESIKKNLLLIAPKVIAYGLTGYVIGHIPTPPGERPLSPSSFTIFMISTIASSHIFRGLLFDSMKDWGPVQKYLSHYSITWLTATAITMALDPLFSIAEAIIAVEFQLVVAGIIALIAAIVLGFKPFTDVAIQGIFP